MTDPISPIRPLWRRLPQQDGLALTADNMAAAPDAARAQLRKLLVGINNTGHEHGMGDASRLARDSLKQFVDGAERAHPPTPQCFALQLVNVQQLTQHLRQRLGERYATCGTHVEATSEVRRLQDALGEAARAARFLKPGTG